MTFRGASSRNAGYLPWVLGLVGAWTLAAGCGSDDGGSNGSTEAGNGGASDGGEPASGGKATSGGSATGGTMSTAGQGGGAGAEDGGAAGRAATGGAAGNEALGGAAGNEAASGSGGTAGDGATGGADGGGAAGDGAGGADGGAGALPEMFVFEGTAEGTAETGELVTCSFYGELLDVVATADGFEGIAIGELFRRVENDEGAAGEFAPLIGGPASVRVPPAAPIEFRAFGDQPDHAVPFWLAIEVLLGAELTPYNYEGEWTCAPVLLDDPGFLDVDFDASGTWTLTPAE